MGAKAQANPTLGTVGAESAVYRDALGLDRMEREPAVTWHPDEPLLVMAGEDGVSRWTPAGLTEPVLGHRVTRTRWDTGAAEHPAGGLVVTLCSDQGATLGLFGRVDQDTVPAALRVLRRALVLDCDGYEKPVFSVDGRHLAIRGNAYDNSVEVFEFPSLRRVLASPLGEPSPGYPYPPEWLDRMLSWSRHNIAFGALPGTLWVGTPDAVLVEVDVDRRTVNTPPSTTC
ncbi:hypothetical protein ACQEWB_05455 [Streptomyces sp. CA-249302]|uniref:hypothetical protein n=1 Tax=Streptomyces sp. CA-249302 TaxID=3240058 RepID=UPI003D8D2A0D